MNAEFQAAKKSGTKTVPCSNNPKLSGRERAQQMARDRIAEKIRKTWSTSKSLAKQTAPEKSQKNKKG